MRSSDPSKLIAEFRGLGDTVLVKTCGFKDAATTVGFTPLYSLASLGLMA